MNILIKNKIQSILKNKLNIHYIQIKDITNHHINHKGYDGGGHYTITIVSNDFINLSLIDRHKKIYEILQNMIKKEIHALSLRTYTAADYKEKRS